MRIADEVRQAGEMLALLVEQHLDHRRRGHDAKLLRVELARFAQDLAKDVMAHAARRFHLAAAPAHGARLAQQVGERLARALSRHLHQAELSEAADGDLGAVARELLLQLGEHRRLVLLARHVDEVDDDDAAEVAQPQLARDRLAGFEVGLEDGVVEIAAADEAARVHVDRCERFGLVDDEVAARLEVDALEQRLRDLLVDVEQVEDRPLASVVLQLAHRSSARSRSTRSARLRSCCSSVPGGDLNERSRTLHQVERR